MKLKPTIWLVLAIIGFVVTWYFNLQYFTQGGSVLPAAFFKAAMPTALTTAITLDVYISAIVFSIWVVKDAKASGIAKGWIYAAMAFALGLCVAWPLYLHHKATRD